MQYNPGDGSGVVDEMDDICASNNVSFPIASKTRRFNSALDTFGEIASMFSGSAIFDDTNYDATTDGFPIDTTDLISGRQDYLFDTDFSLLRGVFAKDTTGVYHELTEETDPANTFLVPTGNSGVPTKYRIVGSSILLDNIPNYASVDGLKIVIGRKAYHMTISDTTRSPGVPSMFHEWLAQVASMPFLIANRMPNKNDIALLIQQKKDPRNVDSIPYYYANRNKARKPGMRAAKENNK